MSRQHEIAKKLRELEKSSAGLISASLSKVESNGLEKDLVEMSYGGRKRSSIGSE
jgi:hypothetical protein